MKLKIYVNSLCGIIILHFCGRLISIENFCNTTIRENTGIMTSQLIIIMIENLLILLFVRIVVLFLIQIINMLMSLNKTKQIMLLFVHIYLFRKLIKVFVLALFVKIVLGFFLLILLVLILILMLILMVIFG